MAFEIRVPPIVLLKRPMAAPAALSLMPTHATPKYFWLLYGIKK